MFVKFVESPNSCLKATCVKSLFLFTLKAQCRALADFLKVAILCSHGRLLAPQHLPLPCIQVSCYHSAVLI